MIVSYDEMNEYLHRGECLVKFVKANGDIRMMACTLKQELLPNEPYETTRVNESKERMIVWDLDKEAFRSFRLDSVVWVMAEEKDNVEVDSESL